MRSTIYIHNIFSTPENLISQIVASTAKKTIFEPVAKLPLHKTVQPTYSSLQEITFYVSHGLSGKPIWQFPHTKKIPFQHEKNKICEVLNIVFRISGGNLSVSS